jgi:hypothetical protein
MRMITTIDPACAGPGMGLPRGEARVLENSSNASTPGGRAAKVRQKNLRMNRSKSFEINKASSFFLKRTEKDRRRDFRAEAMTDSGQVQCPGSICG